jgi:hypothetical protein
MYAAPVTLTAHVWEATITPEEARHPLPVPRGRGRG